MLENAAPLVPPSADGPSNGEQVPSGGEENKSSSVGSSNGSSSSGSSSGKPLLSVAEAASQHEPNGTAVAAIKADRSTLSLSSPVPLGAVKCRTKPAGSLSMRYLHGMFLCNHTTSDSVAHAHAHATADAIFNVSSSGDYLSEEGETNHDAGHDRRKREKRDWKDNYIRR